MTLVLGIDFETTGLNPETDAIIEVGAALWCTERKAVVDVYNKLIYTNQEIPEPVIRLTGIDNNLLDAHGESLGTAFYRLFQMAAKASYLMAHNAGFEKGFIAAAEDVMESVQIAAFSGIPKPWIDSFTDLPGANCGHRLGHVAADHGFINPFPHRALFDVVTMFKVLSYYDFSEVVLHATAPIRKLIIKFPYSAERVDAIKRLGGWGFDKAAGFWHKPVKDFMVEEEFEKAAAAGFTAHVANKEVAVHGN